jgi:CBS domain-containing protein
MQIDGVVTDPRDWLAGDGIGERPELVARRVMRADVSPLAPGDSLARATRLMESPAIRELPVVDGGVLVGILTRTDMEPYRGHFEWTTVRSAMTYDPVTVAPQAPLDDVMRLLVEHGFNSVPVSNGGELLGMIARTDILRALAGPERRRGASKSH